jgi:quercetin dioxygenase-like cupin family protein
MAEGIPIILGPGEGETIQNPLGGPITFRATAERTAGSIFAFESTIATGEGPPLHLHHDQDEIVYVLEGELRFKLEEEIKPAPAGTFVFIPRELRHTWQNSGSAPARILVVFTPAGTMDQFFGRFAALDSDEEFVDAFSRLGREAGMEVVGPPLASSDPV